MSRLILGGHSFISQLGSDPLPDSATQDALVAACLAAGITTFDTTYLPERVALGKCLKRLGVRTEAQVIVWNFFTDFGPDESVGGHAPYEPHHIQQILDELQRDRVEYLVVHPVSDPDAQARQEALAVHWQQQGLVGRLGTWMPPLNSPRGSYDFAVAPCNVTTPAAPARFAAYKALGWETVATSPFVRGWELDKRAVGGDKAATADTMLRFAAFTPNVDRLIVAMRRPEWVATNRASEARGPLDPSLCTLWEPAPPESV